MSLVGSLPVHLCIILCQEYLFLSVRVQWWINRHQVRYGVISCYIVWFSDTSTFVDYLMPKLFLYKNSSDSILLIAWEIKGGPKVNIMTWLEFEFVYFEAGIQLINHYAMGNIPTEIGKVILNKHSKDVFGNVSRLKLYLPRQKWTMNEN